MIAVITRLALAGFIACAPSVVLAQSPTATLSGVITDEQSGRLAGAEIILENYETSWQRHTISDPRGVYRFNAVPPGVYQLTVRLRGFAATVVPTLTLSVSQEASADVTLTIGRLEQSITITGSSGTLSEPARSTLGRTVTRSEIDELPIASRGIGTIATLATLVPGVLTDITTTVTGVATAAQRGDSNAFLIDGLSMDDPLNAALRGSLPLDAIREFTVLTNNVTAEHGQASGLVVNAVTRSGTNVLSARGYYFGQDGRWAATPADLRLVDPLAPKPSLELSVIGGFLAGPLRRDRAFVFASGEQVWRDSVYAFTGSAAAFKTFRPNQPTTVPVTTTIPKLLARADVRLSPGHLMTLRYRVHNQAALNALREPKSDPRRGLDLADRVQDAAVLTTHLLGPGVLAETRAQFARRDIAFDVSRPELCPSCVAENRPGIWLGKPPNAPQHRIDDRWQFAGALSWLPSRILGEHAMKAGIDASFIRDRGHFAPDLSGTFTFDNDAAFDALDVDTYPSRYTRTDGDPAYDLDVMLLSMFLQDDWRPADRLTVGLGVRIDSERVTSVPVRTNVAPRIRLSFDPWHRGRVSFRGGYGRYYDQILLTVVRDARAGAIGLVITNPGYLDPFGPSLRGPAIIRRNTTLLSPDLRTPYTDQITAGFQHQLRARAVVSVDFVHSHGRDLLIGRDLNYPDLSHPARPRPNSAFRQMIVTESRARSWYRGLQIGFQSDVAGVGLTAAYTFADSTNDTDGPRSFPQDQRDYPSNRGPSPNDSRHRLTVGARAALPWDLRLTAIVNARSGLPYNAVLTADANGDGVLNDRPEGRGRNSERGAAFAQADVRLAKQLAIGKARVELLAEVFNLANRTNWVRYDGTAGGNRLGQPLESGPPRQFQIGLRAGF